MDPNSCLTRHHLCPALDQILALFQHEDMACTEHIQDRLGVGLHHISIAFDIELLFCMDHKSENDRLCKLEDVYHMQEPWKDDLSSAHVVGSPHMVDYERANIITCVCS
jgi:hypothetical protein